MHFSYICNYKDSWWTKTTKPHFSQNRVFTSLVVQLWLLFCSILGQLWLVAVVKKLKTWDATISLNCIILKLLWLVQRKTATTKNVLSVESRLDQTQYWQKILEWYSCFREDIVCFCSAPRIVHITFRFKQLNDCNTYVRRWI